MKRIFPLLLLSCLALRAAAAPAYPKPVRVVQPDGTAVTVVQHGDERLHWTATTDGYTLVRDAEGYLTFAQADTTGLLQPTALRYTGTTTAARALGIAPGLRPTARRRAKAATSTGSRPDDMSVDATFPATGKRKLLVLLVNFADTRTNVTPDGFRRMMNEEGYGGVGSFRDYYKEQSYGQLDIDVTVTDWIQVPHNKAVYNTDNAQDLVVEALQMVADTIDLRQFDNDGDGVLDGLAVIHQGFGQEMSASDADIWSHSTVVYGVTVGGVRVARYTIEPELLASTPVRQSTIGVICHEFGHNLGAPDFYDTDYSGTGGEYPGTGVWDLMGSGAWNGDYGTHPAGINAWQKWALGWMDIPTLEADTVVKAMPAADRKPVAYRLTTTTPGDYFILENRQTEGATFDAKLPGHGLVVYHVNETLMRSKLQSNDINCTHPQGIYTVCSDAGVDPDSSPTSYGNVNSATAPFPSAYGHTRFSDSTLPSARSGERRRSYRSLSDITEASDGTISFRFTREAEPAGPEALTAVSERGEVKLAWALPEGTEGRPEAYNVYRAGQRVGRTAETEWTDEGAPQGEVLSYNVDADWGGDLVSAAAQATVMVPANRATALTATAEGGNVRLAWTADPVLSRADVMNGRLLMLDDYTDEVEMANLYRPSDLTTFVGQTLQRMSFLALQGPSTLKVLLRVYEAEADGSQPQLVSERQVSEFASAQIRDVRLSKPVTIREGKSYYLAVVYRPTNGYVTLPLDSHRLTPGLGNLVMNDEGTAFEPVTIAEGNFFVQGTLVAPTTATAGTLLADADFGTLEDATSQLFFPLAWSVYADGHLVGHTTARSVVLPGPFAEGEHTFAISSRYAGANESTALTATCAVGPTDGIAPAPAAEDVPSLVSLKGGIGIGARTAPLRIADVAGRTVTVVPAGAATQVKLPAGVYVAAGRKVAAW